MRTVGLALATTFLAGLLVSTATAADTTTPDLLPGVDLVTEEVEPGSVSSTADLLPELESTEVSPGLHRIDRDGERKPRFVADVDVTSDGLVWVLGDGFLYALGDEALPNPPGGLKTFQMRDNRTASATGFMAGIHMFDGERWRETAGGGAFDAHLTSDGVLWADSPEGMARFEDGAWSTAAWPVHVDKSGEGHDRRGDILHQR